MPPKKKRAAKQTPAKQNPAEPEEPLEYARYVREKSGKHIASTGGRKSVDCDIEQDIREIRALLKVNSEIFERCMGSATNYDDGKSALFTRYGFNVVKVRQNPSTSCTEFITESERSQKKFDMKTLAELPDGLNGVLCIKYQTGQFSKFIDYGHFFQSTLLLHDDVLEPFLAKLKFHIESIQVSLGKVETWLLENKSNQEFLEATFEKKLDATSAGNNPDVPYAGSETVCANCGQTYANHVQRYDYDSGSYKAHCYSGASFMCNKVHILKSCSESGKFEKTFAIAKKSDQTKLKKFLEFMAA